MDTVVIVMKYIILAMHAHPQPTDPYNPSNSFSDSDTAILHPSPFVPIRIPVFGLVMWLNDSIVKVLSVGGVRPSSIPATSPRNEKGRGRGRAFSDLSESVEMGESYEMAGGVVGEKAAGGFASMAPSAPNSMMQRKQGKERVTLGRRKAD